MEVTIELPDEIAGQTRNASGDVARRVLDAFAIGRMYLSTLGR